MFSDLVFIVLSFSWRIFEEDFRGPWRHPAGAMVQGGLLPRPPRCQQAGRATHVHPAPWRASPDQPVGWTGRSATLISAHFQTPSGRDRPLIPNRLKFRLLVECLSPLPAKDFAVFSCLVLLLRKKNFLFLSFEFRSLVLLILTLPENDR